MIGVYLAVLSGFETDHIPEVLTGLHDTGSACSLCLRLRLCLLSCVGLPWPGCVFLLRRLGFAEDAPLQ